MITDRTPATESFWNRSRSELGISAPECHVSSLFDPLILDPSNPHLDLSDQPALIGAGKKRGTAHLAADFARHGIPRRQVGDYWVLLSPDATPMCLVRVTAVIELPFDQVPLDWARVEGEGDESLAWWQEAHRQYYIRQCANWGVTWDESAPVVCEAWELVAMAG